MSASFPTCRQSTFKCTKLWRLTLLASQRHHHFENNQPSKVRFRWSSWGRVWIRHTRCKRPTNLDFTLKMPCHQIFYHLLAHLEGLKARPFFKNQILNKSRCFIKRFPFRNGNQNRNQRQSRIQQVTKTASNLSSNQLHSLRSHHYTREFCRSNKTNS